MRIDRMTCAALAASGATLLAACATPPAGPDDIRIVRQASAVQACRAVGTVEGSSGYYGRFDAVGLDAAERVALVDARSRGANTVRWDRAVAGTSGLASVSGVAYAC
jgi:hypothetical protein